MANNKKNKSLKLKKSREEQKLIRSRNENKLSIWNNCIVDHGFKTLYFAVNLYNYELYTLGSIGSQLDSLCNLITNIENSFSTVNFSLLRFNDIVSPESYLTNFIKTVRLWNPDFTPTREFINNVQQISKQYCFLAIDIDEQKSIDFNQASISEMIKDYVDDFMEKLTSFEQQKIDTKRVKELSTSIENIGQSLIKPCPEDILLTYYIKQIFPSYSLIIPEDELEEKKAVLAYIQQEFIPERNYFTMTNSGVGLFGGKPQPSYGCVIDLVEFPEEVESELFSLTYDDIVINSSTLEKNKAKIKFKRKRADIEYEEEQAFTAGAEGDLELEDFKDLADMAIAAVSLGKKIVESDIHLFIQAPTVEELNKKRSALISALKDINIVATFNSDQAKTYVDSFIKLRPKDRPFLTDLRYIMSFRLNAGDALCDVDSKYTAPILGEYVTKAQAMSL